MDTQTVRDAVARVLPQTIEDLKALVAIESISSLSTHDDRVRDSAQEVARLLREAGCQDAQIVEAGGKPAVIARFAAPEGKPTVCLYAHLKKRLSALDLTVFGVGVVIGAGIFTVAGRAAGTQAGPAVVISFLIAAACCGFAALCYAEFASTIPVSGSAYTFSYASLGELVAWIIGWDLLLELRLGAGVVAQGWSAYLQIFLGPIGIELPKSISAGSSWAGRTCSASTTSRMPPATCSSDETSSSAWHRQPSGS
ncbi:amino acid permease [Blastococcus sp. Marseille-P5729]|uniref:amino acid permease n=1 Tax=Blastococcus sp. Marseille-P5729 TaxID=2086582 RepID=UPI000D0EB735|nr:amino acid permease [Blastococcus sp. Marseille-P5729]